ncbi:MAG TPA: PqqD family protein [Gemmatimonadales bacterium]|nr:PqqD family protein [Gemmatimonadales bacterium]
MLLPVPNPDVIYRPVTEGAVVLSTRDEIYYGLNPVGSWIWEHLPPVHATLDDLCAELRRIHPDVAPDVIYDDARALLTELAQHGLVLFTGRSADESRITAQAAETQPSRVA